MMRRVFSGFAVCALAAALASCGGASKPPVPAGPDPATLAPPSAAAYGEVVVRPGGDMRQGVDAAARKVSRLQDPGGAIRRKLDEALARDHASYERDIAPWLGPRAGGFVLGAAGSGREPDAALIVAARDRAALGAELAKLRAAGRLRAGGSYRGIPYASPAGRHTTAGVVGDFLVVATSLHAFQAAVDASKGSSLADGDRFRAALKQLDPDRLAFAYADPREIAAIVRSAPHVSPQAQRIFGSARFASADPVTASLTAKADRITLQLTLGALVPPPSSSAATVSVADLPGDSWLALATPPLGPLVRQALDETGAHAGAAAQVRRRTGLDLDRDVLGPLGGLGAFARGSSVLDLGAGVLLRMHDPTAAGTLMTRLQAIAGAAGGGGATQTIPGGFQTQAGSLPQPIVVLAQGARIAAGYAEASATALLAPPRRFADSAAGKAAIATLGDGYTPSLVLLAPPLVQLLRSVDAIGAAHLQRAISYLSAYRSLAAGTKRDGVRTTVRIVAALK